MSSTADIRKPITETSVSARAANAVVDVDEKIFNIFSNFLLKKSGFALPREKSYLLETRLSRVAGVHGFGKVADMAAAVAAGPTSQLEQAIIEAMTTNETLFFRDQRPFQALRTTVLPDVVEKKSTDRRLRILCAAASTGQEP